MECYVPLLYISTVLEIIRDKNIVEYFISVNMYTHKKENYEDDWENYKMYTINRLVGRTNNNNIIHNIKNKC